VIEYCEIELLIEREQYWIDTLKPWYNVREIADSNRGVKRSQEYKDAASKRNKGRKYSPEHCAKLSLACKGRVKTPEHLAKIALANKGKKRDRVLVEASRQRHLKRYQDPKERLKRSLSQKEIMATMSEEKRKERGAKISATALSQNRGKPLIATHLSGEILEFGSLKAASKHFEYLSSDLCVKIKRNLLFKEYIFKYK